jgi:hypothetical protein
MFSKMIFFLALVNAHERGYLRGPGLSEVEKVNITNSSKEVVVYRNSNDFLFKKNTKCPNKNVFLWGNNVPVYNNVSDREL